MQKISENTPSLIQQHRRPVIFLCGVLFLVLFAITSKYADLEAVKRLDFDATVKIQDNMPKIERIDSMRRWEDSGMLASPLVTSIAVVAVSAVVFVIRRGFVGKLSAVAIPIGFALLVLAELYGKSIVHHPAPPFFMIKNPAVQFPRYYINEQYSYPSGHAARSLYLAFVAWCLLVYPLLRKRRVIFALWSVLLLFYVLVIAVGRIYLGHHWLSDVVGGWLIALGIAAFATVVLH